MIKLVDIESYVQHGVQFGTCELCMRIGDLEVREYIFEDSKTGETRSFDGGYWDWGDYVQFFDTDMDITEVAQVIKDAKIKTFDELRERYFKEPKCYYY